MTSDSMTDVALLAAIRAAPDDDAPRLVYADWLDEHGQPERAEFIRVQCELARRESPALREREAELLATHHDAFAGPLAAPHLRFRFHRGFIVGFGQTGFFVSTARVNRGDWSFFSFKSNGAAAVIGLRSQNASTAAEMMRVLAPYDPYNFRYQLDAVSFPARIRITSWDIPRSAEWNGHFRGATFSLDNYEGFKGRPARTDFSHVHLDGFDSFPEA
jgi:uncharacterized protein (TIGR02996 family)